ncbi:MAG: hypothetical protein WCA35_03675 [Kovacikia sp.]
MHTNWKGYRWLAWIGQAILGIASIMVLAQGRWMNALGLICFLIASLVFVLRDERLPTLFDFLFVVAALLNAGGWVWGWFHVPGPYDEITHAFTIFAITLALSFFAYHPMWSVFRQHTRLYLLTIASFGIAIGALWEVAEWLTGVIGNIDDTVTDLMMDALGAGIASLSSLWVLRSSIDKTNSSDRSEAHSWGTNLNKTN